MTDRLPPSPALQDAMAALATVLEAENAALARSEFSVSGDLADAKREAIAALDLLAATTPSGAGRSLAGRDLADRNLRQRLDGAVRRNRGLLQQAIDTQQRVIATIVRALDPDDVVASYPATDQPYRAALPVALTLSA